MHKHNYCKQERGKLPHEKWVNLVCVLLIWGNAASTYICPDLHHLNTEAGYLALWASHVSINQMTKLANRSSQENFKI